MSSVITEEISKWPISIDCRTGEANCSSRGRFMFDHCGVSVLSQGIPAICGIDTRMLTKKIRSRGAMPGRIEFEGAVSVCWHSYPCLH